MKLTSRLIFLFACLLSFSSIAQQDNSARIQKHQKSIQLNLGSQGIGAEFNYGLSAQFTLRAGGNVIPVKVNNVFEISDFESTSNLKADVQNIHLLADFSPFKAGWLRLVGGVAYFMKANGNIRVTPDDNYKYGDLVLTPEQVGYLDLNMDWKGAAPYFGLGFGRIIPNKKFNVNFDLGSYYLTAPKATITGTGLLSGNSSQSDQFQSNVSDYRWLPVLQLNLNFKL